MSTKAEQNAVTGRCCQGPQETEGTRPAQMGTCCGGAPGGDVPEDAEELRAAVRERYAAAARRVGSGCACSPTPDDPITRDLYSSGEVSGLPKSAVEASLGCGNPTALTTLSPGDVVLDLGSGGGLDVLVSARRVAPTGKAYGLDMTDEMLALARRHQAEAGVANAEFLKGTMEAIPLPDASVDVVISNCVINLAADKSLVLAEAFRVLRPGGRFAVSDIVVEGTIPAKFRKGIELWAGCLAGALDIDEFKRLLLAAGFVAPEVEVTRRFGVESLDDAGRQAVESLGVDLDSLSGHFCSAFVRATKQ